MKTSSSVQLASASPVAACALGLCPGQSQELKVLAEDLSKENLSFVVRRLTAKDGVAPDVAEKTRLEFLRFVALRKTYSGTLVPSALVDTFWHAFILHTEKYTEFCLRHIGKYMHHRPQDHSHSSVFDENIAARRTLEHLSQMFPGYDRFVWADSAICSNDGDCGCP